MQSSPANTILAAMPSKSFIDDAAMCPAPPKSTNFIKEPSHFTDLEGFEITIESRRVRWKSDHEALSATMREEVAQSCPSHDFSLHTAHVAGSDSRTETAIPHWFVSVLVASRRCHVSASWIKSKIASGKLQSASSEFVIGEFVDPAVVSALRAGEVGEVLSD